MSLSVLFWCCFSVISRVWLFVTPWTAAHQASLSITSSQSLLKLMSTESVVPSNHPILDHPILLLPSIFPRIRVISNGYTPCTVAGQAPLSTGFSRQEYWSGWPFPPPEDLPNPQIKPESPVSLALQADSLLLSHQGSPLYSIHIYNTWTC